MSSIAVSWVLGANFVMSAPWPKHHTLRCSQTCRPAGLSVCWATTSQPRLASVWTAAASLAGSNQESIMTSLVVIFGFTACAASVKAFTPSTTSGTL